MNEPKIEIQNGPLVVAEPFITKPEVAKRVGKSVRCVDDWIKRGWIPFYKVGRSVLFKWSEIEKSLTDTARISSRN